MSFIDQIGSSVASGLGGAIGGLPGVGINFLLNSLGMSKQQDYAKDMMDYQWQNYGSPKAQVNALAAAGINPAVALGQGGTGAFAQPSLNMPTFAPVQVDGVAPMLSSLTQLKKVDKENNLVDQQISKTLSETEAQKMHNEFTRKYGNQKWLLDLSNAYQNVLLAQKTNDIKDQEKAINEWKKVSEKAISASHEYQRDMLKKDLANKDEEIRLSNNLLKEKANTERSSQSANYASANASKTQADVNREMARYQRVIADVEESSSPFKLENLLRHYAASNMISDADYQEAYRRYERLKSINVDNDKHEWNKALDAFMFYLEEHVKGLSPFVSAATK